MLICRLTFDEFCKGFDEVHTLTSGMDGIVGYININVVIFQTSAYMNMHMNKWARTY